MKMYDFAVNFSISQKNYERFESILNEFLRFVLVHGSNFAIKRFDSVVDDYKNSITRM